MVAMIPAIRATARMTGASKNTVLKLLVDIGEVCAEFQDGAFRNLGCKRVQCDEIWSFCLKKNAKATEKEKAAGTAGDVWTWTAIDADTKLVPCWMVGGRDAGYAWEFMHDLASRLSNRVQLTTDGHKPYLEAVGDAFGSDIDYAMLVKLYGKEPAGERRYSPAHFTGSKRRVVEGDPDKEHISTSYVERQNLTMRMSMRRFTRLTNAFSKKVENHAHAIALHYMYYNFVRIHRSLRVTPAMAAGVTDRLWDLEDIVGLLEEKERTREREAGPRRTRSKKGAA